MEIDAGIESALRGSKPLDDLRSLIKNLLSQGRSAESILTSFEQSRQQLRVAGQEADEDVLMEAMDFLTGRCSPQMKLPADREA